MEAKFGMSRKTFVCGGATPVERKRGEPWCFVAHVIAAMPILRRAFSGKGAPRESVANRYVMVMLIKGSWRREPANFFVVSRTRGSKREAAEVICGDADEADIVASAMNEFDGDAALQAALCAALDAPRARRDIVCYAVDARRDVNMRLAPEVLVVRAPWTLCARCGIPADLKCSGCREARYCSAECQEVHWDTHQEECRVAAQ